MKNIKRIVLLALVFMMVLGAMPVGAIIPYSTYTYDIDGNYVESPHAYVPYEVITSATLGIGDNPITDPQDFCTGRISAIDEHAQRYFYWDGRIYISDANSAAENPRVVIAEYSFEESGFRYVAEITEFVNEWGIPDKITSPRGLYAIDNQLYVCDIDSARILVFATADVEIDGVQYQMGDFIRTIAEPESEVISDNHVYRPLAVAVSSSGYIYVVGESTHQGVISINSEGEFAGFIGTQSQSLSFFDMLWRKLQTEEQRNKSVKNVSTSFNNININEKGFVYATTLSINPDDILSAVASKSITSDASPIKMLNPNGQDVMKRSGFFPPVGEVTFQTQKTADYATYGPSQIYDVGLGPEGTWSIIDSGTEGRQKIFTYDEDGNLLFAFGDKGSQLGNVSLAKAIDYAYGDADGNDSMNYLMVLDETNDAITVYRRTEYGDVLIQALQNQRDRKFDKSEEDWREILQRNSNFDMSYIGIGKSLARQEKYPEAMEMFKAAYDTENYSEAWQQVRKAWVEDYVIVIPIVIVAFFIIVSKIFKYANKVNEAGLALRKKRTLKEEFMYGFHVMFHPFDGYWDIKHEYRASTKGATLILAITVLSFIYYSIGQSYIIKPTPDDTGVLMMFVSVLLPILLWVIANWCLTTLFDGEGSIRDIYIATCYALFPLPPFLILTTLLSNIVTVDEAGLLSLALGVALFWCGFLLFFGMQVIHDYSLFKNVLTTLASIVGMAFIMFIGVLFSSLLGKIVTFVVNIVVELSYRV